MFKRVALIAGVAIVAASSGYWGARRLSSNSSGHPIIGTGLTVDGGSDVTIDRTDRVTPLEHTFRVYNPTSQSITIGQVKCGCTCMAAEPESHTVSPGATIPLKVTVRSFPAYKASYCEKIWVETSAGVITLSISGKLPLPERPVYRPDVLYMDATAGVATVEREVALRVPKQCCRNLTDRDITWKGSSKIAVLLTEEPPSELYREFRIRASVSAESAGLTSGQIHLDTGCGPVHIAVRPSKETVK